MIKSEFTTIIDATPEAVFARLDDVKTRVEDFPACAAVKEIKGQGEGSQARFSYKMFGLTFDVNFLCTEYVANKRVAGQLKGAINGTDEVTLEPHDGGTKLRWMCEYSVPVPLVGKIAESLLKKQNERDAEAGFANLKDRVESEAKAHA